MTDFILILLAAVVLTYLALSFRLGRVAHCRPRLTAQPACRTVRNNKKPAWVVNEVVRLKAYLPHAGSITLAHTFNRLHGATRKMTVS